MSLAGFLVLAQMMVVPMPSPAPPPPMIEPHVARVMEEHGIKPLRSPAPGESIESLTGFASREEVLADGQRRVKEAQAEFFARHAEERARVREGLRLNGDARGKEQPK